MLKSIALAAIATMLAAASPASVDIYSAKELRDVSRQLAEKQTPFASRDVARYGNHYTMMAYRNATGSSELHEHEADIFIVESGEAVLVTGGKLMNPHAQKAGEIRGSSIEGGERHTVATGDVIHIPAGVAHQLVIEKGKPFSYFVVKVAGQ